jgi:hypothetical protein
MLADRFLQNTALGNDKKNYATFIQVFIEDPRLLAAVFHQQLISTLSQAVRYA